MKKHAKQVFVFYVLVFAFMLLYPRMVFSQSQPPKSKKIIFLFVTPLEFNDVCRDDLKGFSYLFLHGAAALMNTRAAKTGLLSSSYLTLGASVRAYGSDASLFNAGEVAQTAAAREMFFRNTGIYPPLNALVNPYVQKLVDENKKNPFSVSVGALGNVLRDAGMKRAVLGNADTDAEKHREAGLFLMDENGVVDMGDVSLRLLMKDVTSPFGLRTNYETLFREFTEFFGKADVLAADTGDFYRLEEAAKMEREEVLLAQKEKLLHEADAFLQKFIAFLNVQKKHGQSWVLFVLSSQTSAREREDGNLLSPVFVVQSDEKPGVLTSASTRRKGIVANLDVAASVLDFLQFAKPSVMLGRKMDVISGGTQDAKKFLCDLHAHLVAIARMNTPMLRMLLVAQGALVVLFFFFLFAPRVQNVFLLSLQEFMLLWGSGLPLFLLFLGAFPAAPPVQMLGIFVMLSFSAAGLLVFFFRPVHAFLILTVMTTFFITMDGMRGSEWMQYSALGFSHMGGSRYYGIGNEYMGILLSSAWIAFGLCGDVFFGENGKARKFFTHVFFLFYASIFCIVIGIPSIGANFGGLLTYAAASVWLYKECKRVKFHFRTWLLVFTIVFCVVSAFIFIDVHRGESMSHIGKFYLDVQKKGFPIFWQTAARKASMNLKLIQFTLWTKVLLVCGAFIVYLFRKKPHVFRELFARFPLTAGAMKAVLAGGIVGFLVNDSGIIVATTCVLGLSFTLLYLLFFGETTGKIND